MTPGSGRSASVGIDVGTSSTKGVLVGHDGTVLASATRTHAVDSPQPSHVEMDPGIWWQEVCAIGQELAQAAEQAGVRVESLGLSGMGPCVVLTDEQNQPVRSAILYGVDMRTAAEIKELTQRWGAEAIRERCGSELTSQAAGLKVWWVSRHEPQIYAQARRVHTTSSWLVARCTDAYVMDQHSASQFTPLYDAQASAWYAPWADVVAPGLILPELAWSGESAGALTADAAMETGFPQGIPVTVGTVDAWAEAASVDALNPGDLMVMYGTTMFLIASPAAGDTGAPVLTHPALWGTAGLVEGSRNLAGGLATSGAVTSWFAELTGSDHATLTDAARSTPAGADGLLVLPYFAGERTPIQDPDARGVIAGLTLRHSRGAIYRAILEGTALAVRHNVEVMRSAGAPISRVVAVGGGTQGDLWTQIVTDATGLDQVIPSQTIGAAYGMAYLAARLIDANIEISQWNPPAKVLRPRAAEAAAYGELFPLYLSLYETTRDVVHALAARQGSASRTDELSTPPTEGATR